MEEKKPYGKTKSTINGKTIRAIESAGAVWRCQDSGPCGNRMKNPSKPGCGHFNGEWTKRRDGNGKDQWKPICKNPNCQPSPAPPKKTSLNAAKILLWVHDRFDLDRAVYELNQGVYDGKYGVL